MSTLPPNNALDLLRNPDSTFTWIFEATSGERWGGWLIADTALHDVGDSLATAHGRYRIIAEQAHGVDLSDAGLEDGQVHVDWYFSAILDAFLVTRAGAGAAVGMAGLGSELDAVWLPTGWAAFGQGGAQQAAAPTLVRYSWVFEATSGDRIHGTLIGDARDFGPGDRSATDFGSYRITAEDTLPGDTAEVIGTVRTTRYWDAGLGRDLALESNGANATGSDGLGSEIDRAWTGSAWVQVGQGGRLQADGAYFGPPRLLVASFGVEAGGWTSQDLHPRLVADLNGDGRLDIAGFGNSGVWSSVQNISGGFEAPHLVVASYGVLAGGWTSQNINPRFLADVNGDGRIDIVGFGNAGVYASVQDSNGNFLAPRLLVASFGAEAGGWTSQATLPRFMADINGDGLTDIVGFGNAGVYGSLQDAQGNFGAPRLLVASFGVEAGGWLSQDRHPRLVADLNGDGRLDIAGFGNSGVWASFQNISGGFDAPTLVVASFGVEAGGWMSQDIHPRSLADIDGDGRVDILGFGNTGVWASLQNASGGFDAPRLVLRTFGVEAGGWTSQETLPRMLGDIDGDGRMDIVGFGNSGVWGALAVSLDLI